uniref:Uncharacterized protein n=1 Tax=Arundo donax TaxID=35708 RepID=A0A0A8ZW28_ARUDO
MDKLFAELAAEVREEFWAHITKLEASINKQMASAQRSNAPVQGPVEEAPVQGPEKAPAEEASVQRPEQAPVQGPEEAVGGVEETLGRGAAKPPSGRKRSRSPSSDLPPPLPSTTRSASGWVFASAEGTYTGRMPVPGAISCRPMEEHWRRLDAFKKG